MIRRNPNSRGPRWIRTKYRGRCRCGRKIRPGDRALYSPVRKRVFCLDCGQTEALRVSEDVLWGLIRRR
jgi:hypothetical protein